MWIRNIVLMIETLLRYRKTWEMRAIALSDDGVGKITNEALCGTSQRTIPGCRTCSSTKIVSPHPSTFPTYLNVQAPCTSRQTSFYIQPPGCRIQLHSDQNSFSCHPYSISYNNNWYKFRLIWLASTTLVRRISLLRVRDPESSVCGLTQHPVWRCDLTHSLGGQHPISPSPILNSFVLELWP